MPELLKAAETVAATLPSEDLDVIFKVVSRSAEGVS
jgi:hypothetical protein